jgi:hypothetical protein
MRRQLNCPTTQKFGAATMMKISDVRRLAAVTLHDLGMGDARPAGQRLLIKDRTYLGCRFEYVGASVIWLKESGQVKFFDGSGRLLKIIKLNARDDDEAAKQAA